MIGMTGYSSVNKETKVGKVSMSLRSLNSKFLEIKINSPTNLIQFEKIARDMIKSKIKRGKIDLFVEISNKGQDSVSVEINEDLVKSYFSTIKNLSLSLGVLPDIEIKDIISLPGIIKVSNNQTNQQPINELKRMFSKLLDDVLKQKN